MSESYWEEEANSLEIQLSELQEKYDGLEQQNEQMLEALKFIKEFGYNNPGCGFSCAKVADDTIESITNKIIDE